MKGRYWALALLLGSLTSAACAEDDREASFTYIQSAILAPQCATVGCHSTRADVFAIRFDDYEATYSRMTGGECATGPGPGGLVVPGDPDASLLMARLRGEGVNLQMPPDRPMPKADIDLVAKWIAEGALCN